MVESMRDQAIPNGVIINTGENSSGQKVGNFTFTINYSDDSSDSQQISGSCTIYILAPIPLWLSGWRLLIRMWSLPLR